MSEESKQRARGEDLSKTKKNRREPTNPNEVALYRAEYTETNEEMKKNCLFYVEMTRTIIMEQQRLAGHS